MDTTASTYRSPSVRSRGRCLAVVAVVAAALVVVPAPPAAARPVPWAATDIATSADGAFSVAVGDLDGDGDLDLASASQDDDTIAWYENVNGDGSAWVGAVVAITADSARSVAVGDLDGDGDLDLASASFSDNTIAWYENLNGDGSAWAAVDIATTALGAHSVAIGDLDGDGDLDLASASGSDDTIAWYVNLNGDGSAWAAVDIAVTGDGAHSVAIGDLDGDGDLDLASASQFDATIAWYRNVNGDGSAWVGADIATSADSARSVAVGDLDGDGDLDLASASLNDDAIAWYRNLNGDGTAWAAADVATTADGAFSVAVGDLDGDGDLDLASASFLDNTIAWYENLNGDGSAWTPADIATSASSARSVAVGDLDGDGDLDLASASSNDDTIAWYENETIHRGAAPWAAANVATSANFARSVAVGDLDGDGDLDLASASEVDDTIAWYENLAGDGSAWAAVNIDITADAAVSVAVGDLDGDGDLDLVAASADDDTVAWYVNTAGDGSAWTVANIDTTADGAQSVAVGDLDGDGDLDVASALSDDDAIAWYRNTVGDGSVWTRIDVALTANAARSVAVGDLDGDGDLDLASASADDDTIAWYENTAGDGSAWAAANIDTTADAAVSVAIGDLDGDGDLDLASASGSDDTVAWYVNLNGDGSAWAAVDIDTTADSARSVAVGDLDGDGDADLAAASSSDDTIAWYENTAGDGSVWAAAVVATTADAAQWVAVGDLDGDGDLDLASASGDDDTIAWYENEGAQLALATADTAPAAVVSATVGDVLAVTATHQGRAGDHAAALTAVGLRLEAAAADPLTQAEAEAIVEELRVYRDDGDGVLDAGDTLLVAAATLAVDGAGDLVVAVPDVAGAAVAFGTPGVFLVAVSLAADAYLQAPDTLRVTHRPAAAAAVDADAAITVPLSIAPAAEVASTTLTATNSAPVADAGGPYTVAADDTTVLDGSGSSDVQQAANTLSYAWDLDDDGLFDDANVADPTFDPVALGLGVGAHTVEVEVTDAGLDTDTATAMVTVTALPNTAPVADAGGPYSVVFGATVVLDAGGSSDAEQAAGTLGYEWDLDDDGVFDDADVAAATFDPAALGLGAGAHTVGLRVTDVGSLTGTDTATVTVTPAPGGGPARATTTTTTVRRVAGVDRYATAAALNGGLAPGVATVYVASGEQFPDALAVGPVAGVEGAALLLVRRDEVPAVTAVELARLAPGRIVIVGGTAAIGAEVDAALAVFTTGAVTRIAGPDRYATAARLAGRLGDATGGTVHLVGGNGFADAIAAGPAAGAAGGPILLSDPAVLPEVTVAALEQLEPGEIVLVGGTATISVDVEAHVRDLHPDATVVRVAGADRYATAATVAARVTADPTAIYIATGADFPDALAATPAAIRDGAPIVLVPPGATLPAAVVAFLAARPGADLVVLAGTGAIPEAMVVELRGVR